MSKLTKSQARERRHHRIRNRVTGTAERPRLNVFRSLKHIYAQLIDDTSGRTILSASSLDSELKMKGGGNIEAAKAVGRLLGQRARAQGLTRVVFDRGGFLYHGRVRALADGARESGLEF